jgi:polyhydroxyalkanoate synthesis repressor PhaR
MQMHFFADAQHMNDQPDPSDELRVELRRYPNRRYYDCTRSQHLTLDDIYRLVGEGYSVTVRDSKTEEDITARILTQLILDHDPPKLAAFPVELLHQIIRSNESLLRDFVEKYFSGALTAFLKSQREFDHYLGQTLGLYSAAPLMGRGWAEMMMGPFMHAFFNDHQDRAASETAPLPNPPAEDADLRLAVDDLKRQLATLRKEVEER